MINSKLNSINYQILLSPHKKRKQKVYNIQNIVKVASSFILSFPIFYEFDKNRKENNLSTIDDIMKNPDFNNVAFIAEFGQGKSSFLNTYFINNKIFEIYKKHLDNPDTIEKLKKLNSSDKIFNTVLEIIETANLDKILFKKISMKKGKLVQFNFSVTTYETLILINELTKLSENQNISPDDCNKYKNYLENLKALWDEKNNKKLKEKNNEISQELEKNPDYVPIANRINSSLKDIKNLINLIINIAVNILNIINLSKEELPVFVSVPEFNIQSSKNQALEEDEIQSIILRSIVNQTKNKKFKRYGLENLLFDKNSKFISVFIAIVIVLFIALSIALITLKIIDFPLDIFSNNNDNIIINGVGKIVKNNDINENAKIIVKFLFYSLITTGSILLLSCVLPFTYKVIRFKKYKKIKSLTLENITIEKDESLLSFSKNKEFLYSIFKSLNTSLIIFEDLDRLQDRNIFNSLRTLNNELNEYFSAKSYLIKEKKIKFMYVVSESIFDSSSEKNKFFDEFIEFKNIVIANCLLPNKLLEIIKSKYSLEENESKLKNNKLKKLNDMIFSVITSNISDQRTYLSFLSKINEMNNLNRTESDHSDDETIGKLYYASNSEELKDIEIEYLRNITKLYLDLFNSFEIKGKKELLTKKGTTYQILLQNREFKNEVKNDFEFLISRKFKNNITSESLTSDKDLENLILLFNLWIDVSKSSQIASIIWNWSSKSKGGQKSLINSFPSVARTIIRIDNNDKLKNSVVPFRQFENFYFNINDDNNQYYSLYNAKLIDDAFFCLASNEKVNSNNNISLEYNQRLFFYLLDNEIINLENLTNNNIGSILNISSILDVADENDTETMKVTLSNCMITIINLIINNYWLDLDYYISNNSEYISLLNDFTAGN
ncbi:YobI family P-loop NTPase [Mycoplasma seminis]|uniref:YobI-like P-loop NTPase domain-containing protein n=1 Tax=Mycoplasma seminis TaxID=512749 RepID=A0ABY9HBY5_9MOLU|nr:hypothetical protein [Mycoplasma seminis]WLP85771.1 hypothetical protein Q8852_01310 [Mycoplasma seminis]